MCLAQGQNAVMPVRLKTVSLRSRVKHSTTEPLHSLVCLYHINESQSSWVDCQNMVSEEKLQSKHFYFLIFFILHHTNPGWLVFKK